jgi:hypothetical protein
MNLTERRESAKTTLKDLFRQVNGSGGPEIDGWREAFGEAHPTLVGMLAKNVGWGILYRAIGHPAVDVDRYIQYGYDVSDGLLPCERTDFRLGVDRIPHPVHDGRIDCTTIIGARLLAMQSFI